MTATITYGGEAAAIGTVLAHALHYARCGWRVFPIWPIAPSGSCSCGKSGCKPKSAGKHPRITGHLEKASSDLSQVTAWWTQWPDAYVGIRCGAGLVVLDVDVKENRPGAASLAELERQHGPLPPTYEVVTGSGGRHLYFWCPPQLDVRRRLGFAPGLDLMAEGGFVVAPPSPHLSGQAYRFANNLPVAAAPAWITQVGAPAPSEGLGRDAPASPSVAFEQASPDLLAAARRRLADHGPAIEGQAGDEHTFEVGAILLNDFALTMQEAWPIALEWNATCRPPWQPEELGQKLLNGETYAKGERGEER